MRRKVMAKKMTWAEICKMYPQQKVALTNVEWIDGVVGKGVKSGIVARSEKDGYTRMQIRDFVGESNEDAFCIGTGPGNVIHVGMMNV